METLNNEKLKTIAIIGNPNVGKSSIFNHLTGLNQKIGNYSGVTVDKSIGFIKSQDHQFQLIDLPGTYSIFPNSEDELVAYSVLSGMEAEKPDAALVILDACNLERGLLLATQIMDLGIPLGFVLNMKDVADKKGIQIKSHKLYEELGIPIILTDARKASGMDAIRTMVVENRFQKAPNFLDLNDIIDKKIIEEVKHKFSLEEGYQAFQLLVFAESNRYINNEDQEWIKILLDGHRFSVTKAKLEEAKKRSQKIKSLVKPMISNHVPKGNDFTNRIDKILIHPVWGYAIFLGIMLVVFQAIFAWAEAPMDLIDAFFASLSASVSSLLPKGVLTDLLAEGLIPGIGGVVIFVPQIALLFGFLAILEDTGYLSRVVFLMDRIMRPMGMHGKSVVPLISAMACAIPAVMAARPISNRKEKLITILVAPWMSCSARLPVYIIIIGLVLPSANFLGISYQALALLGMYLLGVVATLGAAFVLNLVFKQNQKSYLLTELPIYRIPRWKAVGLTMFSKSKVFVLEAGKVILSVSIILWVLASYGPSTTMDELELEKNEMMKGASSESEINEVENLYNSKSLENSYIAIMGRTIEPIIKPLGYDWKIGIAIITSFAAREVFIGTLATIYSIGEDVEDEVTLREKMAQETNPATGEKVFNLATGISLMVFYAFAMQCMSTLAVVRRETKTWKWPIYQTVVMTAFAYVSALIAYQIFN